MTGTCLFFLRVFSFLAHASSCTPCLTDSVSRSTGAKTLLTSAADGAFGLMQCDLCIVPSSSNIFFCLSISQSTSQAVMFAPPPLAGSYSALNRQAFTLRFSTNCRFRKHGARKGQVYEGKQGMLYLSQVKRQGRQSLSLPSLLYFQ